MKMILMYFLIASSFCYGQNEEPNGEQKVYFETGINLILLNYTDMNEGGKGDPFLQWNSQIRVGLPFHVFYRTDDFQVGIAATLFAFGSKAQFSNIGQIFAPNDANFHIGYNLLSPKNRTTSYFGPFAEVGVFNMGRAHAGLRPAFNFGFEAYFRNSARLSIGIGTFQVSDFQKAQQNLDVYYTDNNFLTLKICRSFPLRLASSEPDETQKL